VTSVVLSLLYSLRFIVRSRVSLHWKSSRSGTRSPSWTDPAAHVFASRRPTESLGRGSRRHGAAGARPCTSWSRRQSSRGTTAGFACCGRGRADTASGGRSCHTRFVPWFVKCPPRIRCGCAAIHGELQKLGISVSQSTVATYMRPQLRPPSQTWRTVLTNHASQIVAADLFVVPTITFRLLFVLVLHNCLSGQGWSHRQQQRYLWQRCTSASTTALSCRCGCSDTSANCFFDRILVSG